MRRLVLPLFVVAVAFAGTARADDADAKKVIDKAIKAHGGAETLAKLKDKSSIIKGKMNINVMGGIGTLAEGGGRSVDRDATRCDERLCSPAGCDPALRKQLLETFSRHRGFGPLPRRGRSVPRPCSRHPRKAPEAVPGRSGRIARGR